MKKILVVSGHTDLENGSFANKLILNKLKELIPEVDIDYLDREYPDFRIDVKAEQEKLVNHDIIVWQFPVFWYSYPSLLHRWVEEVFVHGFSHGRTGKALHGKKLVASFTTGSPAELYKTGGVQLYSIDELIIPPIRATANLCGMDYEGYVYTGDLSYASRPNPEKLEDMRKRAKEHAERLAAMLKAL